MLDGEGKPIPPGSWGGDLDPMRGSRCRDCGAPIPFGNFCPAHLAAARKKNEEIVAERIRELGLDQGPQHSAFLEDVLSPKRDPSEPNGSNNKESPGLPLPTDLIASWRAIETLRHAAEEGQVSAEVALDLLQQASELCYALAGTARRNW